MFLKLCQHVKDQLNIWYFCQYKTKKRCNEAVQRVPWVLKLVPEHRKTQETCNEHVPDQYKTHEMCNEAM